MMEDACKMPLPAAEKVNAGLPKRASLWNLLVQDQQATRLLRLPQ